MARVMQMRIIAEGVEEREQAEFLKKYRLYLRTGILLSPAPYHG